MHIRAYVETGGGVPKGLLHRRWRPFLQACGQWSGGGAITKWLLLHLRWCYASPHARARGTARRTACRPVHTCEAIPAAYCGACWNVHKVLVEPPARPVWGWPAELRANPDMRDQRLTVEPYEMVVRMYSSLLHQLCMGLACRTACQAHDARPAAYCKTCWRTSKVPL